MAGPVPGEAAGSAAVEAAAAAPREAIQGTPLLLLSFPEALRRPVLERQAVHASEAPEWRSLGPLELAPNPVGRFLLLLLLLWGEER